MSNPGSGDFVILGSGSFRTGGFFAGGFTGLAGALGVVGRFAILCAFWPLAVPAIQVIGFAPPA
jgi:hypothetical protein